MTYLIMKYLIALADYNYRKAYWYSVNANEFNLTKLGFMVIEEKNKS
jgi:hypothetical protein